MLYRYCGTCRNKYPIGDKCLNGCMDKQRHESNKGYDKFSRNKESTAVYATKEWKQSTKQCKDKFNGLDIYEYYINSIIVYGNLSHHIIELTEDKSKAYELDNLIYLSDKTHKMVHIAYKNDNKKEMQQLLIKLIRRYESEFK